MSDWQPSLLLHWYDRNPKSVADDFTLIAGPHATTERISYTCPAKKKAIVEFLQIEVVRVTAATVLGKTYVYLSIKPISSIPKRLLHIFFEDNNVAKRVRTAIGTTLTLFAGDMIFSSTSDLSTGGSIFYFIAYKITEFSDEPPNDFVYVPDPTPEPDLQQPLATKDPPM